jgi:hypothetical protein
MLAEQAAPVSDGSVTNDAATSHDNSLQRLPIERD